MNNYLMFHNQNTHISICFLCFNGLAISPMCEYRRIVDVELLFIQVVKLIDNIMLILVAFG